MLKVKLRIGCGYAGVPSAEMEVKYDGEEYLIMRQNDILAIIKD